MKRIMALFLVMVFLVSVVGCAPKSEYDKLRDAKTALEKKSEKLSSQAADLKTDLTAQQKAVASLEGELKRANAKVTSLANELKKANAKIGELTKKE